MARVSYTALRSLRAGVNANDAIDYDFDVTVADRQTRVTRTDQVSLGGQQQTNKDRTEELWRVSTLPILEADFEHFRQFLDSCDGGELFTFDPYGTFAAPIAAKSNCVLTSKGYSEKRISQRYLAVQFTVKVIP